VLYGAGVGALVVLEAAHSSYLWFVSFLWLLVSSKQLTKSLVSSLKA
jgi:hypothetical protein